MFDPSHRGTRVNQQHNMIEVKHTRQYNLYDPYIIAQNARQVYYATYLLRRDKANWWVVIKTKPMGRIEIENVSDVAYQNKVAVADQIVDDELENNLEHPQPILEKVYDDEIIDIANTVKEINEGNELFWEDEWDHKNETTDEEEWKSDEDETSDEED